jgi:hypothetical protein
MRDRVKLARDSPHQATIPRERPKRPAYTEEQLIAMRGGLTVEEYTRRFMRKWGKK